jgi:uncharacterized membrane protein
MQIQAKNLLELNNLIQNNDAIEKEFKENPKEAIQKYSQAIPNTLIYQIVVSSLGLVVVIITLGIVGRVTFGTPVKDADIPNILTALGSAAIGALAGLLAPSPSRG